MLDPHEVVLSESGQRPEDVAELREQVGRGPIRESVMAYEDSLGIIRVIDGHHRTLVAREKGLKLPVIVIPEKEYRKLSAEGYHDTQIKRAYAVSRAEKLRRSHAKKRSAQLEIEILEALKSRR
jgi:hypothetical protein